MAFQLVMNMSKMRLFNKLYFEAYRKHRKEWFGNLRAAGNLLRKTAVGKLRTGTAGPDRQTGTLLRNHVVQISKAPGSNSKDNLYDLKVGPKPGGKAFYGKFHELGVVDRKPGGMLLGRPWLAPTLESKQAEVERMLTKSLRHIAKIG